MNRRVTLFTSGPRISDLLVAAERSRSRECLRRVAQLRKDPLPLARSIFHRVQRVAWIREHSFCTLRGMALYLRKPSISLPVDKKRPPFVAGAKLPWFSLLRELGWRPY